MTPILSLSFIRETPKPMSNVLVYDSLHCLQYTNKLLYYRFTLQTFISMSNYRGLQIIDLKGLRPEVHGLEAETKQTRDTVRNVTKLKIKPNILSRRTTICKFKELILFSLVIK